MKPRNKVFIATSIDGYIADKDGGIEWLESVPNPEQKDTGYLPFMDQVDAIVMGRVTFETVCGFDCPWPYTKPVFVLSKNLKSIPEQYKDKATLLKGEVTEVLKQVHQQGYQQLYIDGGATIQGFLKEDLIDDLIITTIPVVLGDGFSLFGKQDSLLQFEFLKSEVYLNALVQNHFRRKR